MPTDPPTEQLVDHNWRLKILERGHETLVTQLEAIDKRAAAQMEALLVKLDAAMGHMRSHACPAPGACGKLMTDMVAITNEVQRLDKLAVKGEEERHEIVEKLNSIQTDIAVSKGGLKVTLFWVGVMASAVGGVAAIATPLLLGK